MHGPPAAHPEPARSLGARARERKFAQLNQPVPPAVRQRQRAAPQATLELKSLTQGQGVALVFNPDTDPTAPPPAAIQSSAVAIRCPRGLPLTPLHHVRRPALIGSSSTTAARPAEEQVSVLAKRRGLPGAMTVSSAQGSLHDRARLIHLMQRTCHGNPARARATQAGSASAGERPPSGRAPYSGEPCAVRTAIVHLRWLAGQVRGALWK